MIKTVALAGALALSTSLEPGRPGLGSCSGWNREETRLRNKPVVVETKDGTEHTFHYASDVTIHGASDTEKGAVDAAHGVTEGSKVAVHYTVEGGKETAHEVDKIGDVGLKTTDGTVSHIDRGAKTILADGTQQTFHLTDRAAKDTRQRRCRGHR